MCFNFAPIGDAAALSQSKKTGCAEPYIRYVVAIPSVCPESRKYAHTAFHLALR